MTSGREARRAVATARAAFEQAATAIESDTNRVTAVKATGILADGLRTLGEDAAGLRAELVAAIIDGGFMTRRELADRLEVTKGRIDQLVKAGRKNRPGP